MKFLVNSYKNNKAFAGFYLTDEPFLSARYVSNSLYDFYRLQVQQIRRYSQLPVIVAPYLGEEYGVGISSPQEIADRAARLQSTGVTIQAWQDGIGADGRFSPAQVKPYYQAIASRIGKNNLWSDIELFNGYLPLEPNTFGGTRNKPTLASRLAAQLSAASSDIVSKRVTWINSYFMSGLYFGNQKSKIERLRSSNAHRLFDAYAASIGLKGKIIRNATYT